MSYWVGMVLLITTLVLCITSTAKADEVATVEDVSFETYHVGSFRTSDFQDSEERNDKGLAFNINLGIGEYVKWKNRVWTNGNDSQLHTVGWEYDISAQLHKNLSLFWYHHSQHAMDDFTGFDRFPLRNYYGARFHFVTGGK